MTFARATEPIRRLREKISTPMIPLWRGTRGGPGAHALSQGAAGALAVSQSAASQGQDAATPFSQSAASQSKSLRARGAPGCSRDTTCRCRGMCRQAKSVCGADFGRRKEGCGRLLSDTEQAAESSVCRNCRCDWCDKAKWKSRACCRCQYRLASVPHQAVRQYSATLAWMLPVDLVAFVSFARLANPVQALILAQLWCPVCVQFVATYKGTLAKALSSLLRQMTRWRAENSAEWQWHLRYMANFHECGLQLWLGPEALARRLNLIRSAKAGRSTRSTELIVFTQSGNPFAMIERNCEEHLKELTKKLPNSWSSSAPAGSRGAVASAHSRAAAASTALGDSAGRSDHACSQVASGAAAVTRVMAHYNTVCQAVAQCTAVSTTQPAEISQDVHTHVCRKLFVLLLSASGYKLPTFPWKAFTQAQFLTMCSDMGQYVEAVPKHWHHKGITLFANMDDASGKNVPLVLHGFWCSSFDDAMSATKNPGLGDRAETYVQEGNSEEFARCARVLFLQSGVPPTPLQVLRKILLEGHRYPQGDLTCSWPFGKAPAVFGEQVPALPCSFANPPPESDVV